MAAAASLPAEVAVKASQEALELGSSAESCSLGWDYWKASELVSTDSTFPFSSSCFCQHFDTLGHRMGLTFWLVVDRGSLLNHGQSPA